MGEVVWGRNREEEEEDEEEGGSRCNEDRTQMVDGQLTEIVYDNNRL